MKITRLQAENVKRLRAVEITPEGNLVVVGGDNGAGKSSVLDSIMYGLAGAKSIPSRPIRSEAKVAKIRLELDGERSLVVERAIGLKGPSLKVSSEGKPLPSPQALLDSLCGKIAFDPLEFTRLKPRDQAERLRDLVGLDFSEHEANRKEVFDERTQVNREAKASKARLDEIAEDKDPKLPTEEVSVAELMEELRRRQETNARNQTARDEVAGLRARERAFEDEIQTTEQHIAHLEEQLRRAQELLEKQRTEKVAFAGWALAPKAAEAQKLVDADEAEVQEEIAASDSLNTRVRAQHRRKELVEELARFSGEAEALTNRLTEFDVAKRKALESAEWPVEGLGFDDDGVTYNGLPFDQASSAEALRVSVAIGAALNPMLRVMLIRDGSLLDQQTLATIAQFAADRDLQLWIERVGDGEECSVVISDGQVREEVAK